MQRMDEPAVATPPHLGRPLRLYPFHGLTLAPRWIGGPTTARTFARPYRDVPRRMRRWERTGKVTRDAEAGLYLHEYVVDGTPHRGLVGALDLTRRSEAVAERAVHPHEGVHPRQVDNLAERLLEMGLNPAPILLVHRGPGGLRALFGSLAEHPPTRAFLDQAGVRHRLWVIRDDDALDLVQRALAGAAPVIADGHHRYAAYLRLQSLHPGTAWDRGLAMVVDQDDAPLGLHAIHRVVPRLRWSDLGPLVEACTGSRWEPIADEARGRELVERSDDPQGVVVATDGAAQWGAWHLPHSSDAATVEVLHREVVPLLPRRRRLVYQHSVSQAMRSARSTSGLALLLPAPSFDLVNEVVRQDRLLPEKATSFQPKPPVGVLMRALRDG